MRVSFYNNIISIENDSCRMTLFEQPPTDLSALSSRFQIWWHAPWCRMRRRQSANLSKSKLGWVVIPPMKDTCPHAMLVAGNRSQQDARYVTQGQGCRHHSMESWYRWWDVFGACGFNHDINLASIPKLISMSHRLFANPVHCHQTGVWPAPCPSQGERAKAEAREDADAAAAQEEKTQKIDKIHETW